MQAVNINSSYGKCRCCLAKGNHQQNIYEDGYIEMFQEYLNLFFVNDSRLTWLLCSACATFLRDVQRFREMVITTEAHLLKYMNKETVFVNVPAEESSQNKLEVKEEISVVKSEDSNDFVDSASFLCSEDREQQDEDEIEEKKGEDTIKAEIKSNQECISETEACEVSDVKISISDMAIRKRRPQCDKTKLRGKRKKYDSDSDAPISQIKEKKAKVKKKSLPKKKIEQKTPISITAQSKHESLKDNNRIRSNIIVILKHSTILPFRNNFKTTFKCFYCDKSCILFKELKEHIETDHTEISETTIDKRLRSLQNLIVSADISCIKCRLCNEEFKTIEVLTDHLINVHKKTYYDTVKKPSHGILGFDLSSDALKCHVCNKDFAFFKNLTVHMNEHFESFVCYVCGKKFLSEHRYKCHVFNTHENKETKCKHCGKTFKTEPSMAYHIKKEHLKRTIQCPQCPETFPFTQYIKRLNHMAVMHGVKKPVFKCDTCGREYANSGSLAAHKRYTHKRINELRCEICGYITVHNTVMKNHMDVHNGVKNYECEFCKKKFAKPFTLKLHLKIHLNDKRFVCSLCDAAFIQKNSLKNHLKARHPDAGIDLSKL